MDSNKLLAHNPLVSPVLTFLITFRLEQIMSNPLSLLTEGSLLQGRYRIKQLIAKGGMGAVYERLGHTLALKQNFYGADEQLKHAFEREARLLANLRHHQRIDKHNGRQQRSRLHAGLCAARAGNG
jgi:hypothetical protein